MIIIIHSVKKVPGIDHSKSPLEEIVKNLFHSASFENPIFGTCGKRDETAIFNPRGETLKVGLQTALSSRFTGTENQILKKVAMK